MEDDSSYTSIIRQTFIQAGYQAVCTTDAPEALALCIENLVDLAIIEISSPYLDGIAISRNLHATLNIPIVALATPLMTQRQIGFLINEADGYVAKPFTPHELLARTERILRSQCQKDPCNAVKTTGDLMLGRNNQKVRGGDHISALTPTECRLLNYMVQHPNQALTKNELILALWQNRFHNDDNALRVLIGRLRQKIENDLVKPTRLLTVYGVGYTLQTAPPLLISGYHQRPAHL
jgi:DNA-binding response OmpR family regulator